MSQPIIKVHGVGKQFRIGKRERYHSLRDTLATVAGAPVRRLRKAFSGPDADDRKEFDETHIWALRDVSFDVQPGEVVGIIGRNGAGKSTLLKILSRITEPTEGLIEMRGRVGSLLEVGTGFHPELTGRENVFLNGAILGMRRTEIKAKFDEIVAFAEIEKFIDTPVKHYSSGMYMRLAFAVAAHLEPEILIVDEVLAVGDAAFQKKCLGKMGEVARHGRTVLFVSHNMAAVQNLCGRVVSLEGGQLMAQGSPHGVIGSYLQGGAKHTLECVWPATDAAPGCREVRLLAARVTAIPPTHVDALSIADSFWLDFDYRVLAEGLCLNLTMVLYNQEETCVFAAPSLSDGQACKPHHVGVYRSRCHIPGGLLNDGVHTVELYFVRDTSVVLHIERRVLSFGVHDDGADRGDWFGKWIGAVRPKLNWVTCKLEAVGVSGRNL